MVLHAVFCAIRPGVSEGEIARVFEALEALVPVIDGLATFDAGPNIDLEKKSIGYTHGFIMRFDRRAALEAYASNPAHLSVGRELVAICDGGADGIMVFDLDA